MSVGESSSLRAKTDLYDVTKGTDHSLHPMLLHCAYSSCLWDDLFPNTWEALQIITFARKRMVSAAGCQQRAKCSMCTFLENSDVLDSNEAEKDKRPELR